MQCPVRRPDHRAAQRRLHGVPRTRASPTISPFRTPLARDVEQRVLVALVDVDVTIGLEIRGRGLDIEERLGRGHAERSGLREQRGAARCSPVQPGHSGGPCVEVVVGAGRTHKTRAPGTCRAPTPVDQPKTAVSRREVQISTAEIQLAAFGEVKYG